MGPAASVLWVSAPPLQLQDVPLRAIAKPLHIGDAVGSVQKLGGVI